MGIFVVGRGGGRVKGDHRILRLGGWGWWWFYSWGGGGGHRSLLV